MDPNVVEKIDPTTNAKFYFNARTKKSSWHLHEVSEQKIKAALPSAGASGDSAAVPAQHHSAHIPLPRMPHRQPRSTVSATHTAKPSQAAADATRKLVVAQAARKRPGAHTSGHTPGAGIVDADVRVKIDPTTNARFYYNRRTKKSSWHLHEVQGGGAARHSSATPTSPNAQHQQPHVKVKIDPATNARFYYNQRTKKSSWHLHEVQDTVPSSDVDIGSSNTDSNAKSNANGITTRAAPPEAPNAAAASTAAVPEAHIVTHVHNGKRFFYCKKTGRSAWHKADLLLQPRDQPSQPKPEPRPASAGTASPAGDVANPGPLVPRRNSRRRKRASDTGVVAARSSKSTDNSNRRNVKYTIKARPKPGLAGIGGESKALSVPAQRTGRCNSNNDADNARNDSDVQKSKSSKVRIMDALAAEEEDEAKPSDISVTCAYSWFIFSRTNPIRRWCFAAYVSDWYEKVVILPILANVVTLMLFAPVGSGPDPPKLDCTKLTDAGEYQPRQESQCKLNQTLELLEIPFNVIFTIEMLVVATAVGFVGHKLAYLRNNWNRTDFVIIILGWLPILIPSISNFSAIRALRVMKVLRTVKSIKSMRSLVGALISSVIMLSQVLLLLALVFFIFGIVGVQLYSGAFHQQCFNATDWSNKETGGLVGDLCMYKQNDTFTENVVKAKGFVQGDGAWCEGDYVCRGTDLSRGPMNDGIDNPNGDDHVFVNFDHIGYAFLTIFACISLEGWSGVMYDVMDTRGGDAAIFFVLLILFGAFFVVNLAIAVVYDAYHVRMEALRMHQEVDHVGNASMKLELQKQLRRGSQITGGTGGSDHGSDHEDALDEAALADIGVATRLPREMEAQRHEDFKRRPKSSKMSMACNSLVKSEYFEQFMTLLILGNTVVLAMERADASEAYVNGLEDANLYFTYAFIAEMVIKHVALGFRGYWSEPFNAFDGVIVLFSVVEIIVKQVASQVNLGFNPNFLRVLRLLRVFKLAKKWPTLRQLCFTVIEALPGLANISAIMAVFVVAFALIGVQLYGGKYRENGFEEDPRSNFNDFLHAVITIFQVMTGEDWNAVMYESMQIEPISAAIIFTLMFFIGNYVMLNLFLAILLENFSGGAFTEHAEHDVHSSGGASLSLKDKIIGVLSPLCPGCRVKSKKHASKKSEQRRNSGKLNRDGDAKKQLRGFEDNEHGIVIHYTNNRTQRGPSKRTGDAPFQTTSDDESDSDNDGGTGSHAKSERERQSKQHRLKLAMEQKHVRHLQTLSMLANRIKRRLPHVTHKKGWRVFQDCFTGEELVHWLVTNHPPCAQQRVTAIKTAQSLMREQFLNRIDGIVALDKLKTQEFSEEHMDYVYNIVPQKRDNMILQGGKEFCDELAAREKAREVKSRKRLLKMTLSGTSLGCLTKQNIFRQWCARLVCSRPFEWCTYVFIATSCVSLAMMSPDHMDKVRPDDPSSFWSGVFWLDVVTTVIFDLEMLLRIVAMGLCFGEDTYLSDGWNVLDFVVNICSTVDQASPSSNLGFFKALRAIRCLRALRLVSRNPGMRMVVNSILQSLPVAVNVVAVVLLVFLVFGCAGVQFFAGKMRYCHDSTGSDTFKFVYNQTQCQNATLCHDCTWKNPTHHFDNIGVSILTLYEVSTLEAWLDILWNCIDSPAEAGGVFVKDRSIGYFVYFMLFIVFGSLLGMNLFVGVLLEKFAELRDELNGSAFLTEEQQQWRETQQRLLRCPLPRVVKEPITCRGIRMVIFRLSQSKRFELAMMATIVLNIVVMAMEKYGATPAYIGALQSANDGFVYVYSAEFAIKVIGLGPWQYLEDGWNKFDFLVLVGSYLEEILTSIGVRPTTFRVLRILRIVRLVRVAKGLKQLLQTLLLSLPSLVNVGSVLLLIFFVFAVLGMNLFGFKSDEFAEVDTEFLNRHANFNDIGVAMLTLFRCSTGESWNMIMHDTIQLKGAPIIAPAFFVTFTLLCFFMMVNLFIAVILENFDDVGKSEGGIEDGAMEKFTEEWENICHILLHAEDDDEDEGDTASASRGGQMFLQSYELVNLLNRLDPPLGLKGISSKWAEQGSHVYMRNVIEAVRKLNIQRNGMGQIFFVDTLHAISSHFHDALNHDDMPNGKQSQKFNEHAQMFVDNLTRAASTKWKVLDNVNPSDMQVFDLYPENMYALAIQRRFRARRARRAMAAKHKGNKSVKWSAAMKADARDQKPTSETALAPRSKRGLAAQPKSRKGSITV